MMLLWQGKVRVHSRSMREQAWVKERGVRMSVTRLRMRINCRELNRRARKSNRYRHSLSSRLTSTASVSCLYLPMRLEASVAVAEVDVAVAVAVGYRLQLWPWLWPWL